MPKRLVSIALCFIAACDVETGPSSPSAPPDGGRDGSVPVEDGGLDGSAPAGDSGAGDGGPSDAAVPDGASDGAMPTLDAGNDAATPPDDAGVADGGHPSDAAVPPDATVDDSGAAMDAAVDAGEGDADASVPPGAASCLVTRSTMATKLLMAPGAPFGAARPGFFGDHRPNLALFDQTLLGFMYARGTDLNRGWSLWSRQTGELLLDALYADGEGSADELVLATGGERFLVASASDVVLRSATDGSDVWRRSGATRLGGVADDGSYLWTYAEGSSTLQAYDATSATPWLSLSASGLQGAVATANRLVVITSDSTSTKLRQFDRTGAEGASIAPLAGRYVATFSDGTHVVTQAAGNFTRVYDLDGSRRALISNNTESAGGAGSFVWLFASNVLKVFALADQDTPVATFSGAHGVRVYSDPPEAVTQGVLFQDGGGNHLGTFGATFDLVDIGSGVRSADIREGQVATLFEGGIVDQASANPAGCGAIIATAADASRLYVSTQGAGTFVYAAPFVAPVATLPSALRIMTTRSGERFALVTSPTTIEVYDADFTPVATRTVPASDYRTIEWVYSLSWDGTKLGVVSTEATGGENLLARWQVVDVATGAVEHTFEHNVASETSEEVVAPRFSPSGARFAIGTRARRGGGSFYVNTAYLYEGDDLIGTFPGDPGAWLDEESLVARLAEGASLVSEEGVRLGASPCIAEVAMAGAFPTTDDPRQWIDATTWLDRFGGRCGLSTGTYIQAVTSADTDTQQVVGLFDARSVWRLKANPAIEVR